MSNSNIKNFDYDLRMESHEKGKSSNRKSVDFLIGQFPVKHVLLLEGRLCYLF